MDVIKIGDSDDEIDFQEINRQNAQKYIAGDTEVEVEDIQETKTITDPAEIRPDHTRFLDDKNLSKFPLFHPQIDSL